MMKKYFIYAVAVLLCLVSGCKKDDQSPEKKEYSIEGFWELKSVETKAYIGSEQVSVYLSLKSGSFELYQKIGSQAGHYKKFTGTYLYSEGKLSGKYSDSSSLATIYDVALEENTMAMSSSGGHETDIYSRISAIPQAVLDDVK